MSAASQGKRHRPARPARTLRGATADAHHAGGGDVTAWYRSMPYARSDGPGIGPGPRAKCPRWRKDLSRKLDGRTPSRKEFGWSICGSDVALAA